MLRLVADENFNNDIVRGLIRRQAELEIVRTQDVGLLGANDPSVLAWAAGERRILLTHDKATMPAFAYERIQGGQAMPGVFVVGDRLPIGRVIEDLLLLIHGSEMDDWRGVVLYLPL